MKLRQPRPGEPADLAKLRVHVRILVHLDRLAGENIPLERFLDQAVLQVARAVQIDYVRCCATGGAL
jgi:hypothetical protein